MNKKFLIIGLIIIGIVFIGGYRVWNIEKPVEDQRKNGTEKSTREVVITTDKNEYGHNDEMKIIIENKEGFSIYIAMEEYSYSDKLFKMEIEEYKNNQWQPTYYNFSNRVKCRPGGQGPAIACVEIQGKGKLERTKSSSYWGCAGEQPLIKLLPFGIYRLKVYIGQECYAGTGQTAPDTIYSNEFTIK